MSVSRRGRPDFFFLFLTVLLVSFGLVMISAPVIPWLSPGIPLPGIPYPAWRKIGSLALMAALLVLVLVLFGGVNANGAQRWFAIGGQRSADGVYEAVAHLLFVSAFG